MRSASNLLSLLIALALVVSPIVATGAPAPAGLLAKVTLCQNGEATQHWVDGKGQPVSHQHDCLKCCLSLVSDLENPDVESRGSGAEMAAFSRRPHSVDGLSIYLCLQARGPPRQGL